MKVEHGSHDFVYGNLGKKASSLPIVPINLIQTFQSRPMRPFCTLLAAIVDHITVNRFDFDELLFEFCKVSTITYPECLAA